MSRLDLRIRIFICCFSKKGIFYMLAINLIPPLDTWLIECYPMLGLYKHIKSSYSLLDK